MNRSKSSQNTSFAVFRARQVELLSATSSKRNFSHKPTQSLSVACPAIVGVWSTVSFHPYSTHLRIQIQGVTAAPFHPSDSLWGEPKKLLRCPGAVLVGSPLLECNHIELVSTKCKAFSAASAAGVGFDPGAMLF